ncbi:MAG: c(7)-type cytochrome triheme domain-containing protein [Thermodesulfovibrionales bacterium]
MKRLFFVIIMLIVSAGIVTAQGGVKKKRPLPYEFGREVINNYSEKAGLAPVVFDHWLHRAKFTCRLCHVDIGFAMKNGATGIKASDNISGFYCGSCHNGKMASDSEKVFESCAKTTAPGDKTRCVRCHSLGKNVKMKYDFTEFTGRLPKGRFGNGIDWEKAEAENLVKPVDFLEGISIKRKSISAQKDFALETKIEGMPDIIFSHKKHTLWNGCELCHPEIFVGVKKGATKYSMIEIFDGKYCGVCHVSVAFPLTDCQRCHVKQVQ